MNNNHIVFDRNMTKKDIFKVLKNYFIVFKKLIYNQSALLKKTTPWELEKYWENDNIKLQRFRFDFGKKIDRFYYVEVEKSKNYSILIARLKDEDEENNNYIYFELMAMGRCPYAFDAGILFFSRDVHVFMNLVLPNYYNRKINKDLICNSLQKDGIYIDIVDRPHPNKLEDCCFEIIYKNQDKIDVNILPILLKNAYNKFIKIKIAVKAYYNDRFLYSKFFYSLVFKTLNNDDYYDDYWYESYYDDYFQQIASYLLPPLFSSSSS